MPNIGYKHTKESKEKISASLKISRKVPWWVIKGVQNPALSKEVKDKISKSSRGKKKPLGFGDKISKALKGKSHSWGLLGKDNPNWKGGIYKNMHDLRASKCKRWAKKVIKRDKVCQGCETSENLQAHHMASFSDFPELRVDLNNGQTLCRECHVHLHKELGGF